MVAGISSQVSTQSARVSSITEMESSPTDISGVLGPIDVPTTQHTMDHTILALTQFELGTNVARSV